MKAWALALASALAATAAQAAVLARGQLVTPLAPSAPAKDLSIAVAQGLDPARPVWVSYSLMAVSAAEKPVGDIALDASPEGVKVPLADTRVVFSARDMAVLPRTGTLAAKLEETAGPRSPQELAEAFGPELYAAYQALVAKKGAMLAQTIVKVYPAPGPAGLRLTGSFDRAVGMQPVLLSVAVGQGDVPPELKDAFAGLKGRSGGFDEKLVAALVSFAMAGFWLWRKFRK